jgi:hypothetical protein
LLAVSPVVEAALISACVSVLSVAGTVIVAVSSFRNTRKVTDKTIQAGTDNTVRGLDAARDGQLWEKKAETYVDALKILRGRELARQNQNRTIRFDEQTEQHLEEWLADINSPNWLDVEARLTAYASQPVVDALANAEVGQQQLMNCLLWKKSLADDTQALPQMVLDEHLAQHRHSVQLQLDSATQTLAPSSLPMVRLATTVSRAALLAVVWLDAVRSCVRPPIDQATKASPSKEPSNSRCGSRCPV